MKAALLGWALLSLATTVCSLAIERERGQGKAYLSRRNNAGVDHQPVLPCPPVDHTPLSDKDDDYPTQVDPPYVLPPVGIPFDKPHPHFSTPPLVPPNQEDNVDDEDEQGMDEDDPRVVLVRTYIDRIAAQTPNVTIDFTGDEGPIYEEQDAVDILDDYYCTDNVTGNPSVEFNCTANLNEDTVPRVPRILRRSRESGTFALAVPQIYRWRRGSTIYISVHRNEKIVLMDVNAGIERTRPAFIAVRASEITAAAMSRAYRFWNNANIGVSFAWTRNTRNSTYLTRTGGVGSKSTILAAADYPAQSIGHQHTIDVYDLFLEASWQPVGPLVLAHELGHTLGIRHNEETEKVYKLWNGKGETIMNAATSISANLIDAIPVRDAEGARILYNKMNPLITDGRIVAVMTPPLGPVSRPPDFLPRKCKWTVFGVCIYYAFEE